MSHKAPQIHSKTESEIRNAAYDFTDALEDGELLTGTPTVEDPADGLTIDNVRVNTAAIEILGVEVAVGKAVQWRVSGGTAGTTYTLDIEADTDATPAQTLRGEAVLVVEED